LEIQIQNIEANYPDYDDYIYDIGAIGHDPYELLAYLTAVYQDFSYDKITANLQTIFDEQYALSIAPESGGTLRVTLTTTPLGTLLRGKLTPEQAQHYDLLLQTKGSRQYLENVFDFDWLPRVTSTYGYRVHPISGGKNYHKGVDIGAPSGTEIHAGQSGIATVGYDEGGYGNYLVIAGEDGLVSKYAHCSEVLVANGQEVTVGDVIALVGSTGNSTGPHLHLEILQNGEYLNPLFFMNNLKGDHL
jgi:murein DD-endopeptidase MepM/ murein hydrolase activator NlpD